MYATQLQTEQAMHAALNKLNCAGTAQVSQRHRCSATATQCLSTSTILQTAAAAGMIQQHVLLLLDGSHCLGCCIVKVVCCNDLHVAAAEDLLACLNVGALQPHNLAGAGSTTQECAAF
jgi:hypothetical protein